jgi:pilus assembly protein FimV
MVKKQAFAVLLTVITFVSSAFGLGLGDIDVKSNLNDPLEAEIKLIQLQGLTSGEILPALASNDDFRRAGVERNFFLSNIQFRVKENESGDLVVTLTTRQAVREPFLNFLVEVNWPGGRLLKEYTVLLDPPVFDTGLAVDALVVESSGTSVSNTDLVTTTVIDQGVSTTSETVAQPVAERDDSLPEGEYRVQRNDTLWEIALKVPDRSGYSPQQVMLAIQDLNPEAFLNNNINRVKAGSVLTLPDGRQIATRTLDEAVAEVQAQNKGAAPKLRAPVTESSEVQLSATESTSSALPTGEGEKNPDGYLELTADSEATTTTASGEAGAVIDQLQSQLSVAEELNDQFERERDELESRVNELQEQIAIMERLLDVQNSDLAQVQNALTDDQADTTTDTQVDSATTTTADTATSATDDQATDTQTPAQPTTTPTVQTPTVTPAPAGSDGIMGTINGLVSQISGWVLASTTNMAITGAGLLLLILLPFYIRSKRSQSDQTLGEMATEDVAYEEEEDFTTDLDDDLLAEVEDDFEEEVSDEPETLDAVVEAEMYMAYQKYDQAEEKLKEAFADHPDRSDVGLKLLEVYAETGDANAFGELESRLVLDSEQQQAATDLRAKLPIGGMDEVTELGADMMSDDLNLDLDVGGDEPDFSAGTDESSDLDFDLDLGGDSTEESSDSDLDFGLETEADSDVDLSVTELTSVEEDGETDLDFSLDLGDLDETSDDSSTTDLDFSLEGLEDESLDLDLNLDGEDVVEPSDNDTTSASDLDFSLELEGDENDDGLSLDLSAEGELESNEDETLDIDIGGDKEPLDLESTETLDLGNSLEDHDFSLDTELSLDEGDMSDLEDLTLDIDDGELAADVSSLSALEPEADQDALTEVSDDASLGDTEIDFEESGDALEQLASSLDSDAELEEDEFDFLSGSDEASTKLDLARAYIEMDDKDGARDILEEVATEGSEDQINQAKELMEQL